MSEPSPSPRIWPCPSCGRRVPMRAPVCHCGMTRERALEAAEAEAAAAPRGDRGAEPRSTPGGAVVLLVAAAIAVVAGLGWAAFGPAPPNNTVPVLGFVDVRPPDRAAAGRPAPKPARPPFRLPWWK